MSGPYHSYLSPKCQVGAFEEKGGCAVFACEPIRQGEVISMWGGRIVTEQELDRSLPDFTQRIVQVEERLFLETPAQQEPSDCFNHSCDPNVGFSGQVALVAMRDIQPGEELTFDYAMCDGSPYDEFECLCGSPHCRRRVTGDDWKRPDLWEKYDGYFTPYLARRIAKFKART